MLALPGKEQQIMKKSFSLKCLFAAPQREQYYINISFHMGKSKKIFSGPRDDYFDDLYDDYDDDSMDDDIDEDDNIYDELEDGLEEVDLDDFDDEDMDSMEEDDELYNSDIYPEEHEEEEADDEYSQARRDIWSDMDWDKD